MRLLLLLLEEREQRHARHLDNLETHAGNVADGVAAAAETGDQHLVVLVHEVEAAVVRHEGGDLLPVLDQLSAAALADGAERLVLVAAAAHGLLVVLVGPPLALAMAAQLAPCVDSARQSRLAHVQSKNSLP